MNLLLPIPETFCSTTLRLDNFNSAFTFEIKYYVFREVTPNVEWHTVTALSLTFNSVEFTSAMSGFPSEYRTNEDTY